MCKLQATRAPWIGTRATSRQQSATVSYRDNNEAVEGNKADKSLISGLETSSLQIKTSLTPTRALSRSATACLAVFPLPTGALQITQHRINCQSESFYVYKWIHHEQLIWFHNQCLRGVEEVKFWKQNHSSAPVTGSNIPAILSLLVKWNSYPAV